MQDSILLHSCETMDDYILYKKGFTASEVEALYNLYK